jgi:iron complex outermembrane recepter protein
MRHCLPHARTVCAAWLAAFALPVSAQTLALLSFADMSLEQLANIEVISVSKKAQPLADAPSSLYVITGDDIRRSGAISVPEALRLAPNLHVAKSSGSAYSISARGANGSNTSAPNKLLVMIDGRSIYSPLFSGVFWDVQDVMLEDIERIEVISGPGGTLWGVNAVNGVINIITRSSADTQGALASFSTGNRHDGAAFRYGGKLGDEASFRVYGKYSDQEATSTEDGVRVDDAWHKSQIGFRIDRNQGRDAFSVHGNVYQASIGQPKPGAISVAGVDLALDTIQASGVNLTAHWSRAMEDGANVSLQAYYDRTERDIPPTFDQTLDIVDLQFQHALPVRGAHALVWGVGYRYGMDHVRNGRPDDVAFLPGRVDQKWSNIFVQDEVSLREDLSLTLGARLERNPYTGNEVLPNVRLAWKAAPGQLLWTAASRAVRAPSRLDGDVALPNSGLIGGPNVRSEVATVYELGYRGQPSPNTSFSVTAFHTDYEHLRTVEIAPSGTSFFWGNEMEGEANGLEMWGTYQASSNWRLSAGYTLLDEHFSNTSSIGLISQPANRANNPSIEGKNPSHTWQLRSSWNVAEDKELDFTLRHVAALSHPDTPASAVPSYTAVDARFGWQLAPDLELSVVGKNLFGTEHEEFGPAVTRSEIPASISVNLVWQL